MFGIEVLILAHSVGNAHVIKQEQEDITKLNRKIIIAKNNEQISSLKQKIMNKLIGKTKNVYKKSLYFEINSSVPIEDNTYIQCRHTSHLATPRILIWPARASTLGHLTHLLFGHFFFLMRI